MTSIHAFRDDALGEHDAVALAELIRAGKVSRQELAAAAIERARLVDPQLNAVISPIYDAPRYGTRPGAALDGVPTFVKDNTDVAGLPTGHGSEAFRARPAAKDGAYTEHLRGTGLTLIGKSRLPEFGFNASTEYMTESPARNPWNLDHSIGASSGGSAALVASGVVPIAHANDGGGSIRIPAACGGLVGLKPSRGRHIDGEQVKHLPLHIISEGVLTRTVRDTAAFVAAAEDHWRNPALPPIGQVHGPARRRLRVGLVLRSVTGAEVDAPTRAAVEHTAALLEKAGHLVEPIALPVTEQFAADFVQYWALLADLAISTGKLILDRSFDAARADGLSRGLRAHHRQAPHRTPGALRRLRRVPAAYARMFARHEVVVSPVLSHTTPPLGHLSPTVPFPELIERLTHYVGYTPLNNIAGTPAISLPMGRTDDGLPVGVHMSAAYGDERTLIELAYLLEAENPFPRIQD
ncbi:amidase [Nocardia sp. NEAU-G5]|uniref:amidase n=1 Tax=Nocardia albiluteola TaxID=2842303 RepID=A0ABS6B5B6_9NOCA|nr:amidase [Nocardia albiluteola]MBU3062658.1 amidase [Nocardia albiluteola]MBU3065508.1 amidase [Nocardia albiluteola]